MVLGPTGGRRQGGLTPWNRVLLDKLIVIQEINHLLRNPKVHYRFPSIIPLSTFRSSKWSLPFRFVNQSFVYISHISTRVTSSAYLILRWLHDPNNILWSSSLWILLQILVISSRLDRNILLRILFPDNLNLCSSP